MAEGKKSGGVRIIGVVALVIGLLWGLSNASEAQRHAGSTEYGKPENTIHFVNDSFQTDGFEFTITSVERRTSLGGGILKHEAPKGITYFAVQYQYKNVTQKPISSFAVPSVVIWNENDTEYRKDAAATMALGTEVETNSKFLGSINPGITISEVAAYEIPNEIINSTQWYVAVNGHIVVILAKP